MLKEQITDMLTKWGHPRTDGARVAEQILDLTTRRVRELYQAGRHAGASGYTRVGLGEVSELENIVHGFGVGSALLSPATEREKLDGPEDPAFGVRKFMERLTAVIVDASRAMHAMEEPDILTFRPEAAGRIQDLAESVQNLDDAISYERMPETHVQPDPIEPADAPDEAVTEQQQLWRALAELGSRVQDLALVQKQILDKLYLLENRRKP